MAFFQVENIIWNQRFVLLLYLLDFLLKTDKKNIIFFEFFCSFLLSSFDYNESDFYVFHLNPNSIENFFRFSTHRYSKCSFILNQFDCSTVFTRSFFAQIHNIII